MVELKTSILSLFIFLSLLSPPVLLAWKTNVKAEASVIYVDLRNILGPWDGTIEHPYRNITSALKNALEGYTIYVRNGTYVENLLINKSVSLIGEHTDLTIIDGSGNENVVVITAENVTVRNFTVRNSGGDAMNCGILLNYSSRVVISYNKIMQNTNGISLRFSSNNIVLNNTISFNVLNGLSLHYSSSNTISDNTISYNTNAGIYLLSSSNNMISGNTVFSNYYGIHLTLSGENIIYHNNFNNTQQAYSDTVNSWSHDGEGNYWSEYSGRDLNYDGIGDFSYAVDSTIQDNYPLMGMFSIFYVDFLGKIYAVPFICNSTISDFKFEVATETADRMMIFNVAGNESATGFCRIIILTELMNYSLIVTIDNEEVPLNLLSPSNETHRFLYVNYTFSTHTIKIISSKTMYLYTQLLGDYAKLQSDFNSLNTSYYQLQGNYSSLQEIYNQLNNALLEHLSAYTESQRSFQNLVYIFAATVAIFLLTTIYLSKRAHVSVSIKEK